MLSYLKMRFFHILETIKINGFSSFLQDIIYVDRGAILVEKNLSTLKPLVDFHQKSNLIFIEITEEILNKNKFIYPLKNRYAKALYYLNKGYNGYGIIKDNEIIGDIWYFTKKSKHITEPEHVLEHPDLKWLGIKCSENHVYSFDMFLNPKARGKNLAAYLQNAVLHDLQRKGFDKIYGYFWANNIPALWVHRMLKWKELDRLRVSRFLVLKTARKKE